MELCLEKARHFLSADPKMTEQVVEIYFRDLKEYKQKEMLEGLKIEKPEEANLDVFPIAICHTGEYDIE